MSNMETRLLTRALAETLEKYVGTYILSDNGETLSALFAVL